MRGTVAAARKDFVGWVYADPDGSEHNTVNCSIADMRCGERGRPRAGRYGCAAARRTSWACARRDHGMPIQPFPDG